MENYMIAPARYFPVEARPLRMQAGLFKFPVDYGNEVADQQYFQIDDEYERYINSKNIAFARSRAVGKKRFDINVESKNTDIHMSALRWLMKTVSTEHMQITITDIDELHERGIAAAYDGLISQLQEDVVVIADDPESQRDQVIMCHVSHPAGWKPENILGNSFQEIHKAVPGFVDDPKAARSMINAMTTRGPYVRFVWSVTADKNLDHHPTLGDTSPWASMTVGYLRFERQISVPLPNVHASIFIIRPYVRDFHDLTSDEKQTLISAIKLMPDDVKIYKGIAGYEDTFIKLLS